MPNTFVYVGNWCPTPPSWTSDPTVKYGISAYRFDAASGAMQFIETAFETVSVGEMCRDAGRNILYVTNERLTLPGHLMGGGGEVYAFSIDPASGRLTEVNRRPSFGSLPSYVAVDGSGKYLIAVHHTGQTPVTKIVADGENYRIQLDYDDVTTVLFPLGDDGAIGEPCDVHHHRGAGGPLPRQNHAQLHSVMTSPDGKLFVVCDKGNDELVVFAIDGQTHKLQMRACVKTLPGSSPRYSVFHPTKPYLFVNFETKGIVCAYRYDESGALTLIATVDALPDGQADSLDMKLSDIQIHPTGRFLYNFIRGLNAVTVFRIDDATGKLNKIQAATLDGAGPRGGAVSPDGCFLVAATHTSKEVVVWSIGDDGRISPTGRKMPQAYPGSVTFAVA